MGLSEKDRRAQLNQLQKDVAYVYNDRLKMEVEHRDTLKGKIVAVTDRVNRYAALLGRSPLPDIAGHYSLTDRFQKITSMSEDIEKAYEDRMAQMEDLHKQINVLFDTLGEQDTEGKFYIVPDDLSDQHMVRCQENIQRLTCEAEQRRTEINSLVAEVRDMWEAMSMVPDETDPIDVNISQENYPLTTVALADLRSKRDHLSAVHEEREEAVRGYAVQIVELWTRLGVSFDERTSFFQHNAGLGDEVVQACKAELARLEALKRDKMKELIMIARAQLEELWDEISAPEQERNSYRRLHYTNDFTELVLLKLEEEVKSLDVRAQVVRPIVDQIKRRKKILEEKIEFEVVSSDPARLLSKKRDPGRLLREEKMRNMITKELPKIESSLRAALHNWKEQHGTPFRYDGGDYLEILGEESKPKKVTSQSSYAPTPVKVPTTPTKSLSTTIKAPSTAGRVSTISKASLNRTLTATPARTPKAATVGTSAGRVIQRDVSSPSQSQSLGRSAASKLNTTLPTKPTTPQGKSTMNTSLTGTAKKRPFGTANINMSPSKEGQDRAVKSLKNLGLSSPGGENSIPLASRMASPSKPTNRKLKL